MPVHMRSYVRQFIAIPKIDDQIAAQYFYPGDVEVHDVWMKVHILTHEMSHGIDFFALQQYGSPFSFTDQWQSNYALDSNSVSDYAKNNWQENFAEVGRIGVYDKVVPGGIGSIQPNWNKIFHQYATYQGYLGDTILPGGSCRDRVNNTAPVPMSSSARFNLGPQPDVSFKSGVRIVEVDPDLANLTFVNPEKRS